MGIYSIRNNSIAICCIYSKQILLTKLPILLKVQQINKKAWKAFSPNIGEIINELKNQNKRVKRHQSRVKQKGIRIKFLYTIPGRFVCRGNLIHSFFCNSCTTRALCSEFSFRMFLSCLFRRFLWKCVCVCEWKLENASDNINTENTWYRKTTNTHLKFLSLPGLPKETFASLYLNTPLQQQKRN